MSLTKRNNRFLRVYQSHRNGFTTVPANLTTTAQELCETLMKKSKVPLPQGSLSLYVCESSDHHLFERRLEDHELPLQIQETALKHQQDESRTLKFILRPRRRLAARTRIQALCPEDIPAELDDPDSGLDSDEELFPPPKQEDPIHLESESKSGWLEIRKQNVWRRRWLVLQEGKEGGEVRIFKSPFHPVHISGFRLADSILRPVPGLEDSDWVFEIDSGHRVILCRAESEEELLQWIQVLRRSSQHSSVETAIMEHLDASAEEVALQDAGWEEKRMARMTQLSGVLEDPSGLSHFLQHLVENHCEENLLFWLDAEYYRCSDLDPEDLLELRKQIFDSYIRPGAALEIALDSARRTRLLQALEEGVPDPRREFFLDMQQATFQLMQNHDWHAFQDSALFQSVLLGLPVSRALQLRHLPICGFARRPRTRADPPSLGFLQLPTLEDPEADESSAADGGQTQAPAAVSHEILLDEAAQRAILDMIPTQSHLGFGD